MRIRLRHRSRPQQTLYVGSLAAVGLLTHPAFDLPTTIDKKAGRFYLLNARFGVSSPDTQPYAVVGVD